MKAVHNIVRSTNRAMRPIALLACSAYRFGLLTRLKKPELRIRKREPGKIVCIGSGGNIDLSKVAELVTE